MKSPYGEITVDRGPSYDGRKDKSGRVFQFIDYADDGRYLVRQSQSVSAIPASPQTLAVEVQRRIDVARAKVVRA